MRIFIEGSCLLKQRSGIGQFIMRLVEVYSDRYPEDEIIITGFKFFTQGQPEYPIKPKANLKYRIIRWLPGRIYNQLFKLGLAPPYDIIFGARSKDIFFFPNFVRFPLLYNRRSLVAVHDLSFIHFSQYTHPKNLPYMLKHVRPSVKKAKRILTISQSSKRQITEYYKVSASKISISNPGVDPKVFYKRPASEIEKVSRKYKLPKKYILYQGTIEPRKNIIGLLKSYEGLPDSLRAAYPLVLTGGKGWKDEEIIDYLEKLSNRGITIVQTGYVLDDDMPAVFSGASLFVYPSFYEGFGIPPLEAMACGIPVITANNSSLPEVAGDAAILLDANDTKGLSAQIQRVLGDKDLQKKLTAKGYEQIKNFSWEKSADQLKKALERTI